MGKGLLLFRRELKTMGETIVEEINHIFYVYIVPYGLNIISAIIIFIVGRWLAQFVSGLVEKGFVTARINKTLSTFVRNLAYYGILMFVVIAILNKLGIETASFLAVIGGASFAVGLALQGALANF